jgi:hypothetical protein
MQAKKVLRFHSLGLDLVDAQHREPIDPTTLVSEISVPHLFLLGCLTRQAKDSLVNAKVVFTARPVRPLRSLVETHAGQMQQVAALCLQVRLKMR